MVKRCAPRLVPRISHAVLPVAICRVPGAGPRRRRVLVHVCASPARGATGKPRVVVAIRLLLLPAAEVYERRRRPAFACLFTQDGASSRLALWRTPHYAVRTRRRRPPQPDAAHGAVRVCVDGPLLEARRDEPGLEIKRLPATTNTTFSNRELAGRARIETQRCRSSRGRRGWRRDSEGRNKLKRCGETHPHLEHLSHFVPSNFDFKFNK